MLNKYQKEVEEILKLEVEPTMEFIKNKLEKSGQNLIHENIESIVKNTITNLIKNANDTNEDLSILTMNNIKSIELELLILKIKDKNIANNSIGSSSKNSTSILLDARIFNTNLRDFKSYREVAKVLNEKLIGKKIGEIEKQKSDQEKLKQYRSNFVDFGFIFKDESGVFCWTEIGKKFLKLVIEDASDFELTKMMVEAIVKNEEFDQSVIHLIQSIKRVYPNKDLSEIYDLLVESEEELKSAIKNRDDMAVPDIWALMLIINNKEFFEFFEFIPIDEILSVFKQNYVYQKSDGQTLGITGILKKGNTRHYSTILASITFAQTYQEISANVNSSDKIKGGQVVRAGGQIAYQRDSSIKDKTSFQNNYSCVFCHVVGFQKKTGGKYIENHHIIPLENLPVEQRKHLDVLGNCVSLCANCHKMVHHGATDVTDDIFCVLFEKLDFDLKVKWNIDSQDALKKMYK